MSLVNKTYAEYKDSGVSWLGKVPEHWDTGPGLALFREKSVKNSGMKEETVLSLSYGKIVIKPPEKLHGLVPESFETYQIVEPGDIIIRSTDLQNDWNSLRVGLVEDNGIITSAYLCLKTTRLIIPEYGHLLLHAFDLMKVFYGMGSGLRQNLSFKDFKRMLILIPPLNEQTQIVKYLKNINRLVNRFIRNRRRLIEVLSEQIQAIINHVVTRGLDPNVSLKPSGVGWLGDNLEHWVVKRLKNIADVRFSNVDKLSKEDEIQVRLCNYTDVYKNSTITKDMPFMAATASAEEINNFHIEVGDVLITKDSEDWQDIGVPAVVVKTESDLVCGYHLAMIRPRTDYVSGFYLAYAIQSQSAITQFSIAAKGVTRYGLSQGSIKGLFLAVPPTVEQEKIVHYLDESTRSLNALIKHAQREIELIREYRTRLITDVVTGKLDVRYIELDDSLLDEVVEEELVDDLDDEEFEQNEDISNADF